MKFAIDFYSGIGGWTLGMKLNGIKPSANIMIGKSLRIR